MKSGKFNCVLDQAFGSSGKGAASARLADLFNIKHISSANYPNAGHTYVNNVTKTKFVAKAIPTAAILNKVNNSEIISWISPGSGFFWKQLIKEWFETGKSRINIHDRASIITDEHTKREREGSDSTKHIASTMQGTATAISDKILRKADVQLAGSFKYEGMSPSYSAAKFLFLSDPDIHNMFGDMSVVDEFAEKVQVLSAWDFRTKSQNLVMDQKETWLHEGSQGYALSIDHGYQFPFCTSRNCSLQAAMDYMAIPPSLVGDVYLNLRTFPIRVGNVIEDGVQKGYSGDFYPDSKEISWEEVARISGMPKEETDRLAERERTTVTKRIRRVSTFSFMGLKDAVQTNGATKLIVNFIQYLNWKDAGLKGGKEAFQKLSTESRAFISKLEETSNTPVVMIGTGADHSEFIYLE